MEKCRPSFADGAVIRAGELAPNHQEQLLHRKADVLRAERTAGDKRLEQMPDVIAVGTPTCDRASVRRESSRQGESFS